jgi:acyl-coenzyme A thioesterase PaaI-like protein
MKKLFLWAVDKARNGQPFWLNIFFKRALPFNVPHGIRIVEMGESQVRVALPDRRRNKNHLKGMHAIAMATACEFASGLSVLERFNLEDFRLIMYRLEMDYHRQPAPGSCEARSSIAKDLEQKISNELASSEDGASRFSMVSELYDVAGERIATAQVHWHVKPWSAVRFGRSS